MNAQPDLIRIPLQQLVLSPHNARKTGGKDIDGLAASIAAHGLLQNLTVTASPQDGCIEFEVIAGGRRLAALQQLASTGTIGADFTVPCHVINDDAALEASTAENTLREAMHPADQFTAFKGMVDSRKSIADVAAHFGVSETVVKQRLKLANVDPQLVQIYREDGMDLDQLQALALTDDHEAQRKAWFSPINSWDRQAHALRTTLTKGDVRASNGVARFVGLEAYEAAGGAVRRDMFSDRDDAWLSDRDLLSKLAIDRLEDQRQKELAVGWSWAEVHMSMDYAQLATYGRLNVMAAEDWLPPELQARLDAVEKRINEIEAIDPDDLPPAEWEAMSDALSRLEDERDDIDTQTEERWPADAMAIAGVLIYIADGDVHIERGRLQPGQKIDKAGAVTGTAKPAADAAKPAKAKKPTLSHDMVHRLELHRAAALRECIASDPKAALCLLVTHLVSQLLTNSLAEAVFDMRPTNVHLSTRMEIAGKFADVGQAPARKALDDRIAEFKKSGVPKKAGDIYAWVYKQDDTERDELLALCVALTLNTNPGARGGALAALFNVDMAKWWQPTAESYLTVVPKALLAEAVTDVAGKAAGEAVLALKKDAAIATAAKHLANTGWLPKPLRGADYAVKKPGTAKAAPPKKAAKTVAKKAPFKSTKKTPA